MEIIKEEFKRLEAGIYFGNSLINSLVLKRRIQAINFLVTYTLFLNSFDFDN